MEEPPTYDDVMHHQRESVSSQPSQDESTSSTTSKFKRQNTIYMSSTYEATHEDDDDEIADGDIPSKIGGGATVFPCENFNLAEDVDNLQAALQNENKTKMIEILCHRSTDQRLKIAQFYNRMYGAPLSRDIKNRLSTRPDFLFMMCGLTMPLYEFMARFIHNSYSHRWMCYIMFVLPNSVRHNMQQYFSEKYGCEIMRYIKAKIKSEPEHPDRLLITQIERPTLCVRDENEIDEAEVKKDLAMLLTLSKDNASKDMAKGMFYSKSFAHIKTVCALYQKESGGSIETLVRKIFLRNKFVILNIIHYAINPLEYFAYELNKCAKKKHGLDEKFLTMVIIMRCETDILDVKNVYFKVNGDTLVNLIRNDHDTSEALKSGLCELIGEGSSNF